MVPIYAIFGMNAYFSIKKPAQNKTYSRTFIPSKMLLVHNNKFYSINFILLGFQR